MQTEQSTGQPNRNLGTWLKSAGRRVMDRIHTPGRAAPLPRLWSGIWRRVNPRGRRQGAREAWIRLENGCLELEEQRRDLGTIGPALESQFLRIAEALESLPKQSETLTEVSEHLLELATGKGEGERLLAECLEQLADPLSYLRSYQTFSHEFLATLRAASERMSTILSDESAIQTAIAPLKHIRSLFRIRAAELEPAAQATFQSLTQEIENLQLQANSVLDQKFTQLKANVTLVNALTERLSHMVEHQGHLLDLHQRAMDQTIADLHSDLERNSQKDIRLTQVTQRIRCETGALVLSLQSQDILGQKCAHILSGLDCVLGHLQRSGGDAREKSRWLRQVQEGIRVESAQLQCLRSDMDSTEDSLLQALSHIESQITEVEGNCLTLSEFGSVTAGATGLVQVLLETLEEIQTRIQSTLMSARDAFESIRPIGGQAGDATETMRELHAQIKLIALNAQVRAAHIGTGTGLDVLAAHTAAIADETGRMSERVAIGLDALTEQLNGLVARFADIVKSGASIQKAWDGNSALLEARLHNYRDRSLNEMQTVNDVSERIRTGLHAMRDQIRLKETANAPICNTLRSLQSLFALVSSILLEFKAVPEDEGTTASYTRTCTMESEKRVQADALALDPQSGSAGPESSGAAPIGPAASISSDRFTTIAGRPEMPCDSHSVPAAAMGILGGMTDPESPVPSASSHPDKPLGNNVELF